MFKKFLNQSQEHDLHFKQEPFLPARVQPDSHRHVGGYQRLKRRLAESLLRARNAADHPPALDPELFVPDGRLALLIQDGRPIRWIQPGCHQLSAAMTQVEARLISLNIFRDQKFGHHAHLDLALNLPYERALLFVDGVQVAIVIPGTHPESPSQKSLGLETTEPLEARNKHQSAYHSEEEDRIQDVSFV